MNKAKNIYWGLIVILFLSSISANAYHDRSWNKVNNDRATNAGGCSRGTASTTIEFNNVRALIHTGGDMWWDLVTLPMYEVPKNSGKTSLFAGAIWVGGTDINDQLRLAAVKFRTGGVDYWPGPLIVSGIDRANVTKEVCEKYDKHYLIDRTDVSEFRAYINAQLSGDSKTLEDNYQNYQVPDVITNWPGNGNSSLGYDFYLAPYFDNDASGDYNPLTGGDYPLFDLDNNFKCGTSRELRRPRLFGDQTMWWVYNDKGNVHGETNGEAIGMEIRAQYYAFATSDELNNMTFGNYALINRSTYTLYNTYFGVWTDADLGQEDDDYVGCDVTRGLGYLYNGDEEDGTGNGKTYGTQPPAIGVDFFEGPYMDPWVIGTDTFDRPTPYLFDAAGNPTAEIDPAMPRDTSQFGLYNGGINGLNFGDTIKGNERWGMRRFLYFNNNSTITGDPTSAKEYYNYMKGLWRDSRSLKFGGTGYNPNSAAGVNSHFMFPGITDPHDWGTEGVDNGYSTPGGWTEENEANDPDDRRFVQSAGPFTLIPGAVNDITVGMVWARASSGGAFESVKKVQEADEKAQQLFDNCFQMIDGPDSPEIEITELDKELIFQIYNIESKSNNFTDKPEDYYQKDPFIVLPSDVELAIDSDPNLTDLEKSEKKEELKKYAFQGYQVFQIKNNSVTNADLDNPELSRLIHQSDLKDDISEIINYETDAETGFLKPVLKVKGNNTGIKHSFKVTEDAFALTNKALVNYKKYYYIAVAYGYNSFKEYNPNNGSFLNGQKNSYLRGRKSASGSIKTFTGMPHKNKIQGGGVDINSQYGDGIEVTMLEGMGNGNNELTLKQEVLDKIMSGKPWKTSKLSYEAGQGPIKISIVDPLNVKDDDFVLRFDNVEYNDNNAIKLYYNGYIDNSQWYMYSKSNDSVRVDTTLYFMVPNSTMEAIQIDTTIFTPLVNFSNVALSYEGNFTVLGQDPLTGGDTIRFDNAPVFGGLTIYPKGLIRSESTIDIENEQIISELGISVTIQQVGFPGPGPDPLFFDNESTNNGFISSSITYSDPSKSWLRPLFSTTGTSIYNWIRSGIIKVDNTVFNSHKAENEFIDGNNKWTGIAEGMFSVYRVAAFDQFAFDDPTLSVLQYQPAYNGGSFNSGQGITFDRYKRTPSINIVITKDTNLWSRCPVVEMCESDTVQVLNSSGVANRVEFIAGPSEGGAEKFKLRKSKSVYRDGSVMPSSSIDSIFVAGLALKPDSGMGWFPGYAIDVETGERLNIFFGEDSRWGAYNGRDMLWNPSSKEYTDLYQTTGVGELVMGAKHNIYVWGHTYRSTSYNGSLIQITNSKNKELAVAYDEGERLYANLAYYNDPSASDSDPMESVYGNVVYVGRPMLTPRAENYDKELDPYGFISSDINIKIRMANPYRGLGPIKNGERRNESTFLKPDSLALNNNAPMFTFSTKGYGASYNNEEIAKSALDIINVVPNPYYAYNNYELKQTQKLVKFINLPENCTISIYNIGGNFVRKFVKSSPEEFLDWNLKNEYGIEVAGGVYIIHIKVPGVGEKVLKWFGALRPVDLDKI